MPKALAALLENPQNMRFESQEDGEEVIFLIRQHWFTQFPAVVSIVILAFLPLILPTVVMPFVASYFVGIPARYAAVFALLWYTTLLGLTVETFINWYFNVFIVTKSRIVDIDFRGLLYKNISETSIRNIEDCTYSMNGVFQSIFNYGDINVQTAAEKREFEFTGSPDPARVYDAIAKLMQQVHHAENLL